MSSYHFPANPFALKELVNILATTTDNDLKFIPYAQVITDIFHP